MGPLSHERVDAETEDQQTRTHGPGLAEPRRSNPEGIARRFRTSRTPHDEAVAPRSQVGVVPSAVRRPRGPGSFQSFEAMLTVARRGAVEPRNGDRERHGRGTWRQDGRAVVERRYDLFRQGRRRIPMPYLAHHRCDLVLGDGSLDPRIDQVQPFPGPQPHLVGRRGRRRHRGRQQGLGNGHFGLDHGGVAFHRNSGQPAAAHHPQEAVRVGWTDGRVLAGLGVWPLQDRRRRGCGVIGGASRQAPNPCLGQGQDRFAMPDQGRCVVVSELESPKLRWPLRLGETRHVDTRFTRQPQRPVDGRNQIEDLRERRGMETLATPVAIFPDVEAEADLLGRVEPVRERRRPPETAHRQGRDQGCVPGRRNDVQAIRGAGEYVLAVRENPPDLGFQAGNGLEVAIDSAVLE